MIRDLTVEMLMDICFSSEDIDVNTSDDSTVKSFYHQVKQVLTTCFKNGYDLSGLDENIVNIALLYWEGLWQGNDDVSCECIDEEGREVSIRLIQEDHYDQHMEENDPEEYESLSDVKYYVSGAYMWIEVN